MQTTPTNQSTAELKTRRINLPSPPAAKPAQPSKPSTEALSTPPTKDSVDLKNSAQEASDSSRPGSDLSPEALADNFAKAWGVDEAAPIQQEAGQSKADQETRPFFGSPGQLYSEKHQSEGGDVNELQQMLGLDQTGKFDETTQKAVKEFQRKQGLKEDGILGPDTLGKLNESLTPEGQEPPKPAGGAYTTKADGSIYHALMEKGFTETEIANGKLLEETRQLNPDLKSSHLKAGTELQVPIRRERKPQSDGENSVGMGSSDLNKGESQSSEAKNNELGIAHINKMSQDKKGNLSLTTEAKNKQNPDAGLKETTKVGPDGLINTASTAKQEGVFTQTKAENADGTAGLSSKLASTEQGSELKVKGLGTPNDTSIRSKGETLFIKDPGSAKAGDVTKNVDISEASGDGPTERLFGKVASFFGHQEQAVPSFRMDGLNELNLFKDKEAGVRLTTTKGDHEIERTLSAGDSDDSWLERRGEDLDDAWQATKGGVSSLWRSLWAKETPPLEASKGLAR